MNTLKQEILKNINEEIKDFTKEKKSQNDNTLKEYYNDILHMTEDMKSLLVRNDQTTNILMLLTSAKKELKSYIDKNNK